MKKLFFAMTAVVALASCGGGDGTKDDKTKDTASTAPTASTDTPPVNEKMIEMLAAKGCTVCHAIDKKVTGPAYKEVAQRYEATPANIDTLTSKVLNGGSGNWGDIPMTANKNMVTPEEAKELVTYILSLRN